ncbi:hypothetical protein [Streptomyces sp. DH37]|uniref:hypothetical protein n=1 Tax=Streptomyces sp. DH37 TaxID=3040122 RepID=UPI002442AC95|nr:hypothetical protein [Streptomyces sp. DH37]MDG9705538.1 hypothetical protein [Streptomyces sp. DH37]
MGIVRPRAGQRVTAGYLDSIVPTWESWTPAWTTSGSSAPSFGDAAVDCQYAQAGDVVFFTMYIVFGPSTNFGSGSDNWRFSLPVAAASAVQTVGFGEAQDASVGGGSRLPLRARLTTTAVMELETSGGRIDNTTISGAGLIDSAMPWTWASGDMLRAWGHYPAA